MSTKGQQQPSDLIQPTSGFWVSRRLSSVRRPVEGVALQSIAIRDQEAARQGVPIPLIQTVPISLDPR